MKKRLFIAIKPSDIVLHKITIFQSQVRKELNIYGIRWVYPELMHLTLQFLGEVEISDIKNIEERLLSVGRKHPSFELSFHGVGYFGRKSSIRTIWVGTEDGRYTEQLYRSVILATDFLKLETTKHFSPHLTLARVSDFVNIDQNKAIGDVLTRNKNIQFGSTQVIKFELIESQLTNKGPFYKSIRQFDLG